MADTENHSSMLPQPTRSSHIMRALSEMSASENNLRTAMPPPATTHKRSGSNLLEPASKRKTLVERAGEPLRPSSAASRSFAPVDSSIIPSSHFGHYRSGSSTTTSSYRSNSGASRHTSNSSLSAGIGSALRPPSGSISNLARPKTALAKDRNSKLADARPTTSSNHHDGSLDSGKSKQAVDVEETYSNFKRMFEDAQLQYQKAVGEVTEAKNTNTLYTETIGKLEQERTSSIESIISLKSENQTLRYRLEAADKAITEQKQYFETQIEEIRSQCRKELETQRQELRDDIARIKSDHNDEIKEVKRKHEAEVEGERDRRIQSMSQVSTASALEKQKQQIELDMKDHEIRNAKADAERIQENLERERDIVSDLRQALTNAGNTAAGMEATRQALQAKIEYLESDSKSQSNAYAEMERRMTEAFAEADKSNEKLRKEETLRRKLHNQVQELKGNIRVFCRVRPTLPTEMPEELAAMKFPDVEDFKDIEIKGQEEKNSLGKTTTKTHPFSFDRVFDPTSNNSEIFEEISQLIQSALDGFNVCIFAYGQTGSGKTYTMSSNDGMIPKALRQIYTTSKDLGERGWEYTMEGSFIEVYNEEIRDLLGKEGENKKHEIRHDMTKCETTITDAVTISLDSQEQVEGILERAMAKRSVAATSANERSSRSHSVFILRLVGQNSITGEQSKGVLNLVDLAGSERLAHSKVEGQRLKETQSINKSLSCLGDVIGALGQQGTTLSAFDPRASTNGSSNTITAHIPYRNSKLTYLLQFSLGGNSKTLMFVMVAPEKKCLSETLTSLKFAEKVSKTRVGIAKKVR